MADQSILSWLVLRVAPQKEFEAARHITERGHEALCPFESKWRRRNSHTRHKVEVRYPLFTRYVFAGISLWPHDFRDIADNIEAIQGVVGYGAAPCMLSASEMRWIRAMAGSQLDAAGVALHKAIEPGAPVIVSEGPFQGRTGTAASIVGKKAHVLMELFNSMQIVKISLAQLERA